MKVKIVASGHYFPQTVVTAQQLDEKMGLRDGWVAKKSGVLTRHYISDQESAATMAAKAIEAALQRAGMTIDDIDCLVSASASFDQPLPCSAALIREQLPESKRAFPAFDVDTTCLSFVLAFDMMSYLVEAGRYNNVVIVSSEIASRAINYDQPESASLFGDGAAAVILTKTPVGETSSVLAAHIETYEKGVHMTEIRGGGHALHPRHYGPHNEAEFLFDMDGRAVFRLSAQHIHGFMDRFFANRLTMDEIDVVIPHQASGLALEHMRKKLAIPEAKFVNVIANMGNVIAASIPLALHAAIEAGRVKRGDKVMLVGTSAGLSIGGIVFEY